MGFRNLGGLSAETHRGSPHRGASAGVSSERRRPGPSRTRMAWEQGARTLTLIASGPRHQDQTTLLPENCWVLRAGKKPGDHLIRPLIVQTSRLILGKGRELRRPTTKPQQMEGWTPVACLFFHFHFCPPSTAGGSFSLKPQLPSEMAAGRRDPRASGWASGSLPVPLALVSPRAMSHRSITVTPTW